LANWFGKPQFLAPVSQISIEGFWEMDLMDVCSNDTLDFSSSFFVLLGIIDSVNENLMGIISYRIFILLFIETVLYEFIICNEKSLVSRNGDVRGVILSLVEFRSSHEALVESLSSNCNVETPVNRQ